MQKLSDIRVTSSLTLPSPEALRAELDKTDVQREFISGTREKIQKIIHGEDDRIMVVVGPCSIHDVDTGLEYAKRLADVQKKYEDRILIVMRVYFEKPRTTVGWKGLIMDPQLNGSCDISQGLRHARKFLSDVAQLGLATATEFVDPITPQYIADLISWAAIGARTTESQTHRQMASGLSMPIGFKNATSGCLTVALNAILAATQPQTFLGITQTGQASAVTTSGNPDCQIILRGGSAGPNYSSEHVEKTVSALKGKDVQTSIMIDCCHDNSEKDVNRYSVVFKDIISQMTSGSKEISGIMLESNLEKGNQKLSEDKSSLQKGVSITDPCIGWDETVELLDYAYEALAPRFAGA